MQYHTFQTTPEVLVSILTACLSSKDKQSSQDRHLWLCKGKELEERKWREWIDPSTGVTKTPPFCLLWNCTCVCRHSPGWLTCLFPCSYQRQSSFPAACSAGRHPALLWQEESLLGWHLQSDTCPAYLSGADNKIMSSLSVESCAVSQRENTLKISTGKEFPFCFNW